MTESTQEVKSFPMPKNENELIECFKRIRQDRDIATVSSNYFLGQMIVAVYKKEYGKDKQQKLATETGFSKSTLYKCHQFALKFTNEQVDELCKGKFALPWRVVVSNLSLEPVDFLKHFHDAKTLDEFCNALINLKTTKSGGKVRKTPTEKKIPKKELEAKVREYEQLIMLKDEEIEDLKTQNAALEKKIEELMSKCMDDIISEIEMEETV
jgi:hypothetical protein